MNWLYLFAFISLCCAAWSWALLRSSARLTSSKITEDALRAFDRKADRPLPMIDYFRLPAETGEIPKSKGRL